MKCRNFEDNMSRSFYRVDADELRTTLSECLRSGDWTALCNLRLCDRRFIIHLTDCGRCRDSLYIYLDIRDKVDYHAHPCFHLAAASVGELGTCFCGPDGVYALKINDAGEAIGIGFCPWCGIEIPSRESSIFRNTAPVIDVDLPNDDWVKCPSCRWRFSIQDPAQWDGWRHLRCGQRLNITERQSV